jgi:16S rRNA (uracil1498-N3)-methyltransferase
MRRRFFIDEFDAKSATLRGDAAAHLGRVLRAERGQLYELSDGQTVWLGRIEQVILPRRGDCCVEFELVEPVSAPESSLQIHLLLSVVKFDRFEWAIEKATELGATQIVPLASARSDKQLLAPAVTRQPRWEKILYESAQQSRRIRPPVLRELVRPDEGFSHSSAGLKIILSESREAPPLRELLSGAQDVEAASLAVGPEGGWTEDEIEAAREAGFLEASLGETILRTETAVIASLAVMRFALG